MDKYKAYIIFVLGYDLLQDKLKNSSKPECDLSFETCNDIAEDFMKSEFETNTKGLYDCLIDYLKSDRHIKFMSEEENENLKEEETNRL